MGTTRLTRHIRASRSLVYRTLLDAEAVQNWMVPDGMTSHVQRKDANELDDLTLILADVGRKARHQVEAFVEKLLARHQPANQARSLAQTRSEGRWTHDFPIDVEHARKLGLPVSTDLPEEVRSLMALYPQPRGRRPAVEYIPGPAPDGDGQRRWVPSPRAPARPAQR